ncbi:hypothetical protein SEUCBS139899_009024 [Sporothrix eucalyptigena]|uniref:Heterokaryon incompatibility domain-containing protein n=1 Tax=Sporothrix eucalyptigena TaxID=1812306 RepID=A0ABP0C292_9PEZI
MRLINTETYELEEKFNNIPPYAILSHTWGDGEVSFMDWKNLDEARKKEGFRKIELTCQQAAHDGYKYAWVDTNCIDKTSSSELSEAINSMFAWYRDAQVCYVFLKDVLVPGETNTVPGSMPPSGTQKKYLADPAVRRAFKASAWFTRGWTLQELLAPSKVLFFSNEWLPLATKESERRLISDITDIDSDYIKRPEEVSSASVARRMSWMAKRITTRVEDTAYCLLGLFGIHMALLYGEGHRAFLRLQEEIIRVSNDQTIFCWQANKIGRTPPSSLYGSEDLPPTPSMNKNSTITPSAPVIQDTHRQAELEKWTSILAPHPKVFRESALYFSEFGNTGGGGGGGGMGGWGGSMTSSSLSGSFLGSSSAAMGATGVGPYSITNFGLSISVPLLYTAKGACAVLDVGYRRTSNDRPSRVVIPLHRVQSGHYIRLSTQLLVMQIPPSLTATRTQIFVDCRNTQSRGAALLLGQRISARSVNMAGDAADKHDPVLFLTFNRPVDLERTPIAALDMDFVPFNSIIEVRNYRLGTQNAMILNGKAAGHSSSNTAAPFYLLVGGRSSKAPSSIDSPGGAAIRPKRGNLPHSSSSSTSMSSMTPGTPPPTASKSFGTVTDERHLSMDWHADVWANPTASFDGISGSDSAALRPLIDRLSAEYFGSWCTSRALRNVLSWRYSAKGALVCYFELDELYSGGPSRKDEDGEEGIATPTTLAGDDDELVRFSHLRKSTAETSSMQQIHDMLNSDQGRGTTAATRPGPTPLRPR